MKRLIHFFGICLALNLSGAIQADDPQPNPDQVTTLEEIVVTATKTREKRKDIPNPVLVKDDLDIRESAAQGIGELLANEPGLDWRTYGDYGGATQSLRIRGMIDQGTQVLINGVSLNSPSLGQADLGGIPLNNIARVEVVKGSGSLLYGSGAMGGTINMITKSPKKDQIDLTAQAGYGTPATFQTALAQGMFVSKNLGYYFTAEQCGTDGFRDNGDLTQTDLSLKLVWDQGDRFKVALYGDYLDRKSGAPGPKPPAGTPDYYLNGTHFYSPESANLVDHQQDENQHTILEIDGQPNDRFRYHVQTAYAHLSDDFYHRDVVAMPPRLAGEGQETWVTNQVNEFAGHIEWTPWPQADLLLGAEYKGYDYEREVVDLDIQGAAKPATRTRDDQHVFTKAAFAEAQYRFSDAFKGLAGIRHEDHSKFGGIDLYRFGLIIDPWEKAVLKLNRGKHFRAPTLNDLYWPDDGWSRGNPDLKPETGWHTDITLEQSLLADKIFVSASYFFWDLKDKIAWAENPAFPTPFPGFYEWTPSNVDSAESDGWELGAKIGPFNHLQFDLSYTRMDIREHKGDYPWRRALETPEQLFKGSVIYWYRQDATATLTARYVGERPANYQSDADVLPQYTLDSYWTLDFKLDHRLAKHWSLFMQANNLFDKEYTTRLGNFVAGDGSITKSGFPGAGRSLFLGLTYEY